jgi:hypothetical protein
MKVDIVMLLKGKSGLLGGLLENGEVLDGFV